MILLDPAPADGGGGTPAPPAAPAPAAPAAPKMVQLAEADFLAYRQAQEKLTTLEASIVAERREAAEKHEAALVEKGKAEDALKLREARYAKEEGELKATLAGERTRFRETYLGEKLAEAVAALPNLAEGAAPKILKLIRDEFEVAESGGTFVVRSRAHEAPAEFLKAYLADPANGCFLKASGGGGAGSAGSHLSPTPEAPAAPADFNQFLIQRQIEMQSSPANYLKQPRGMAPVAPPKSK